MSSFQRTDVVSNMINAFAHVTRLILTAVSNFRWYGQSLPTYHTHVIQIQSLFQIHTQKENLFSSSLLFNSITAKYNGTIWGFFKMPMVYHMFI